MYLGMLIIRKMSNQIHRKLTHGSEKAKSSRNHTTILSFNHSFLKRFAYVVAYWRCCVRSCCHITLMWFCDFVANFVIFSQSERKPKPKQSKKKNAATTTIQNKIYIIGPLCWFKLDFPTTQQNSTNHFWSTVFYQLSVNCWYENKIETTTVNYKN